MPTRACLLQNMALAHRRRLVGSVFGVISLVGVASGLPEFQQVDHHSTVITVHIVVTAMPITGVGGPYLMDDHYWHGWDIQFSEAAMTLVAVLAVPERDVAMPLVDAHAPTSRVPPILRARSPPSSGA